MISKKASVYIHAGDGNYHCKDCKEADKNVVVCRWMRATDKISSIGGCTKWKEGAPKFDPKKDSFLGCSPEELKYEENKVGFGCRRCTHFKRKVWACGTVDKDSPGPDPGVIHPMACCDDWDKDKTFGEVANFRLVGIRVIGEK